MSKNYLYTVLIVFAVLITVIFIGYLYSNLDQQFNLNEQVNNNLKQTDNNLNQPSQPSQETGRLLEFERAVNQDNKSQIRELLAEQIDLIVYATECCGVVDKDVAIDNFDYIDQAGQFNFFADQAIVKQIKDQNPDLQDYFIGVAVDKGTVLGYQTNEDSEINKVYLAVDYNLLVETEDTDKTEQEPICEDMCGDGVCQSIVCLGSGCPCAETVQNCPQDCANNN
jgi:predicted oxidoreductase (fatty acid repression mutant protein)